MSLLTPIENLIHKLDSEGAAELARLKADVEGKVSQVLPVLENLAATVESAVTDAAEAAVPGLKATLTAAVAAAEAEVKSILGL